MNYIKFYDQNKEPHLVLTKLSSLLTACILESFGFEDKMKIIENYFSNMTKVSLKLFFWENYSSLYNYILGFDIENIELLRDYKGKKLPGILSVNLYTYNKFFIKNLLLCHFNSDFAVNPKLMIHPHFLIECENNSINILDIYDDRGMYVLKVNNENG